MIKMEVDIHPELIKEAIGKHCGNKGMVREIILKDLYPDEEEELPDGTIRYRCIKCGFEAIINEGNYILTERQLSHKKIEGISLKNVRLIRSLKCPDCGNWEVYRDWEHEDTAEIYPYYMCIACNHKHYVVDYCDDCGAPLFDRILNSECYHCIKQIGIEKC